MHMIGWFVDALERFTRAVNRLFVLAASVLVVGIMLVTVREVILRYGFNAPSVWAMDSARFALLYAFFLALGPALQSGHHVSVDLFDAYVPARLRRYQAAAGYGLTLVFAAVLFRYTLDIAVEMFETGEMTFSVVPIELKYLYWIGPVGTLEFMLTALVGFLRACQQSAGSRSGAAQRAVNP
jgi:TRAP-type C4-dicarboxylate transport system permease small subunit